MLRFLTIALLALLMSSCHVVRSLRYLDANISDHKIFPKEAVAAATAPFSFVAAKPLDAITIDRGEGGRVDLDSFLDKDTKTTAFLIIQHDSILFERYYEGYQPQDVINIFSASKSVASLLVGIALDEAYIHSVYDPVTRYLPELLEADPMFAQLTIQDVLDMRTGLHFNEAYLNPFSHAARLYYGRNQMRLLKSLHFDEAPGGDYHYLSIATAILGMIVERTTDMPLADYLQAKVWQPMGMAHDASWSVDDKKHRNTKAYCCLNTTAIDLAKIGRLYLNYGMWQGQRIVSRKWVEKSRQGNADNNCYQNQWRAYKEVLPDGSCLCTQDFYAKGMLGQYVYVAPQHDMIIVRLGKRADADYLQLFRQLIDALTTKDKSQ